MKTQKDLKKKIKSAGELHSVVKTMKNLAAISIRQYERSVRSLARYSEVIERAVQAVVMDMPGRLDRLGGEGEGIGVVVLGSDQGMVGDFNSKIVERALELIGDRGGGEVRALAAAGFKTSALLDAEGLEIAMRIDLPGSVENISTTVADLLVEIERWREELGASPVFICHNEPVSGSAYRQTCRQVFPVDAHWLAELKARDWDSRSLPIFRMDRDDILSALLRHNFFIMIFRALAASLAAENASRLASMQAAEDNINGRLEDLNKEYQYVRQDAITSEMLDIASGFEALEGGGKAL